MLFFYKYYLLFLKFFIFDLFRLINIIYYNLIKSNYNLIKFKNIFKQLNILNIEISILYSFCLRLNIFNFNLIIYIIYIYLIY